MASWTISTRLHPRSPVHLNIHKEQLRGIHTITAAQSRFTGGIHDEGAADAGMAGPFTLRDETHVAGSGYPESELLRDDTVVVEPEPAIGLLRIVVIRRHGPGAG